jgi:hypothetical protein
MSAQPLTHHEILGLIEPFTRAGLRVDLSASERAQRKLVFKPAASATLPLPEPGCEEALQLESLGTGTCRLTLTRRTPEGLQATVMGLGSDLAALLAQIRTVPASRQFLSGPGWQMARSYQVSAVAGGPVALSLGEIHLDGLTLQLNVSMVRGVAGELQLTPHPGVVLDLPQDLLAVMGWNWARLIRTPAGWRSRLRMKGAAVRRTARAEAALDAAAAHLARTLAEPPARFHERLRAARWGVVMRRGIPTLNVLVLLGVVLLMPKLDTRWGSGLWMLMYHVPTVLIALSFCLQELPQFEFPPLPRRSRAPSWRVAPVAGPG